MAARDYAPDQSRDFVVLPLCTCTSVNAPPERHRLVVWSKDLRRLPFARRGDRVEVSGRLELFRFQTRRGGSRHIPQFVVDHLRVLRRAPGLGRSIILEGYLGANPQVRQTKEREFTSYWYNRIARMREYYDGRTRARDYLVVPFYATGESKPYRLVVWSSDRICYRNIRLAGVGDKVKVKGRPDVFRYQAADGSSQALRQLIVERMKLIRRTRRSPAIP